MYEDRKASDVKTLVGYIQEARNEGFSNANDDRAIMTAVEIDEAKLIAALQRYELRKLDADIRKLQAMLEATSKSELQRRYREQIRQLDERQKRIELFLERLSPPARTS